MPVVSPPESMVHNMSQSHTNNLTVTDTRTLLMEPVNSQVNDEEHTWLIHEFDNITLIDNAPYIGLRKVDSLIQYLLVCHTNSVVAAAAIVIAAAAVIVEL